MAPVVLQFTAGANNTPLTCFCVLRRPQRTVAMALPLTKHSSDRQVFFFLSVCLVVFWIALSRHIFLFYHLSCFYGGVIKRAGGGGVVTRRGGGAEAFLVFCPFQLSGS